MTIASEITRLQWAKSDIKTSIEGKWISVPSNAKLDSYSGYIDQITQWSPNFNWFPVKCYLSRYAWQWFRPGRQFWCPLSFSYWDYSFWLVHAVDYNSSKDYFTCNYFVFKEWWTDYKSALAVSAGTSNNRYAKTAWYIVWNDNTITLRMWYYGDSGWAWPFPTLTATFNLATWEWTSTWEWTTEWLVTHWNDLFSSVYRQYPSSYTQGIDLVVCQENRQ